MARRLTRSGEHARRAPSAVRRWTLLLAAGLTAAVAWAQPQAVQLPSLDRPQGTPVVLAGNWFAAPGTAPAPALVLLHGCSGMLDGRGLLAARYTELAARLNGLGVHVLVLDSFGPRQVKQICTLPLGQRPINQLHRRRDALGALQWLAAQPGVDAARLGLLGWSNGGSTVLAAINRRHPEVRAAAVHPTLAVAFYPGCEAERARGFEPVAPLLMQLGEADDWTPAAPCKALAAGVQQGLPPAWDSYEGAHHGFDGTAPVRHWREVPSGANPGQGVHVGAHPSARAAAAQRLEQFIRDTWRISP
jgi:dienelactone hydrolase